eukprot:8297353-Alexandrium_andersonii.AAC.1
MNSHPCLCQLALSLVTSVFASPRSVATNLGGGLLGRVLPGPVRAVLQLLRLRRARARGRVRGLRSPGRLRRARAEGGPRSLPVALPGGPPHGL